MSPHYRDKENDELVFVLISALILAFLMFIWLAIGGHANAFG